MNEMLLRLAVSASFLLFAGIGCDNVEEEERVPECVSLRAGCADCCRNQGFDSGSFNIMEDACTCRNLSDD